MKEGATLPHPLRSLAAALAGLAAAVLVGIGTALAGRTAHVFGLYEVVAAVALSVALVAFAHLTRSRPGPAWTGVAAAVAILWLGTHVVTDAALFRLEQGREVEAQTLALTQEFAVTGADTPLGLVDAGLAAETGRTGWRGALVVQLRAGVVAWRALGSARVVRVPLWAHALVLAAEAAFVALIIRRALRHLAGEPTCMICGRYLVRRRLGRVSGQEAARLVAAWQRGERLVPEDPTESGGVALAYEDRCAAGHGVLPGYALVRLRGRGFSNAAPGPIAALPPDSETGRAR